MKPHEIERHQALPHQAEIVLQLDPSLFWFSGHFSVQPLLPGVAQLNWAMDYATTLLVPGWRFHSIQNVKFQSPLLPEATVTLSLLQPRRDDVGRVGSSSAVHSPLHCGGRWQRRDYTR